MSLLSDREIDIKKEVSSKSSFKYIISSKHRQSSNPKKSYWIIEYNEELECFIRNYLNGYSVDNLTWGIIEDNGKLKVLGFNIHKEELKLAKFIDSNNRKTWHGYPADYRRKNQDRPCSVILKKWVNDKVISKAKMLKIRQGQICNL